MEGRESRQRWVRGAGLVALAGLLLQFLGLFLWPEAPAWLWPAGVSCALVALVCGLAAKGRGWTMALVVPSFVWLFLVFSPV